MAESIIYVEGVAGQLFRDLSLAIAYSLMTSLLVALTLLPAWTARFDTSGRPAAAVNHSAVARGAPRLLGGFVRRATNPLLLVNAKAPVIAGVAPAWPTSGTSPGPNT